MSIATSLADGRYLFRNDKGHLYLEDYNTDTNARKNAKADVPSCSLLFGGSAISFALHEEHSLLAILHLDDQAVFLTIYEFNGEELTSLFLRTERVKMPPGTKTVLWVGGKNTAHSEGEKTVEKLHIAVSDTNTWTLLFSVDEAARALSRCTTRVAAVMAHSGAFPFSALQYLGVLDHTSRTIYFYDVNYDKVVGSYTLPQTPEEKLKSDSVISSDRSSDGSSSSSCIRYSSTTSKNFIFFGHGNGLLFSAYVTKGSVRILSTELAEFARGVASPSTSRTPRAVATTPGTPATMSLTEASQTDEDSKEEEKNSDDHLSASDEDLSCSEKGCTMAVNTSVSASPSAWATPYSVVCSAVSTAQVLVSMDQLILPIRRSSSVHTGTIPTDQAVVHDDPLREEEDITVAATSTHDASGDDTSYLKVIKYKYLKKTALLINIMEEKISLSQLPPPFLTTSNPMPPLVVEGAPLSDEWLEYTIVAVSSERSHAIVRCRHLANYSTSSPSSIRPDGRREGENSLSSPAPPSLAPFIEKVVLEESFYSFPFVRISSPPCVSSDQQMTKESMGHLEEKENATNKKFAMPNQESDGVSTMHNKEINDVSAVVLPAFIECKAVLKRPSKRGRRGRGRGKHATEAKASDNVDSVAYSPLLPPSVTAFISPGNIYHECINFADSNRSALSFVMGFAVGSIFMYFKQLKNAKK